MPTWMPVIVLDPSGPTLGRIVGRAHQAGFELFHSEGFKIGVSRDEQGAVVLGCDDLPEPLRTHLPRLILDKEGDLGHGYLIVSNFTFAALKAQLSIRSDDGRYVRMGQSWVLRRAMLKGAEDTLDVYIVADTSPENLLDAFKRHRDWAIHSQA